MVYDLVFMVQHYCLYPDSGKEVSLIEDDKVQTERGLENNQPTPIDEPFIEAK
jgi:hypothetical protein